VSLLACVWSPGKWGATAGHALHAQRRFAIAAHYVMLAKPSWRISVLGSWKTNVYRELSNSAFALMMIFHALSRMKEPDLRAIFPD